MEFGKYTYNERLFYRENKDATWKEINIYDIMENKPKFKGVPIIFPCQVSSYLNVSEELINSNFNEHSNWFRKDQDYFVIDREDIKLIMKSTEPSQHESIFHSKVDISEIEPLIIYTLTGFFVHAKMSNSREAEEVYLSYYRNHCVKHYIGDIWVSSFCYPYTIDEEGNDLYLFGSTPDDIEDRPLIFDDYNVQLGIDGIIMREYKRGDLSVYYEATEEEKRKYRLANPHHSRLVEDHSVVTTHICIDCDEDKMRLNKNGYIYLLHSKLGVKIGRSNQPKTRTSTIGTQMPFKIDLIQIFKINDMIKCETYLHKQFANVRLNGEWFALNKKMIDDVIHTINIEFEGEEIVVDNN